MAFLSPCIQRHQSPFGDHFAAPVWGRGGRRCWRRALPA
ncbi:hypothetical protein AB395_00001429 [Sinorhizobium fredii CCBAU 45436]|nr:hypothetical protein AB395_00001429 [Sinorhizobium fredii CCBAU 45436]